MARTSRGRGPRIKDSELQQMLLLYSQGKSLKAIATSTHRHWQTVRKYVLKELREQEGKDARKEALKSALTMHFQDLVEALQAMKSLFWLPEARSTRVPVFWGSSKGTGRREQLLLQALRQDHARDSPLWGWWDSWQKAWETYVSGVPLLESRVDAEVDGLRRSYGECIIPEDLTPVLLNQADGKVRGSGGYMLDKLLSVRDNGGVDELWLGNSARLTTGRGHEVRQALTEMEAKMKEWPEVEVMAGSYRHLVETRDKMEEEIEVLSLRRAFPGRCRLCPV